MCAMRTLILRMAARRTCSSEALSAARIIPVPPLPPCDCIAAAAPRRRRAARLQTQCSCHGTRARSAAHRMRAGRPNDGRARNLVVQEQPQRLRASAQRAQPLVTTTRSWSRAAGYGARAKLVHLIRRHVARAFHEEWHLGDKLPRLQVRCGTLEYTWPRRRRRSDRSHEPKPPKV